MLCTKKINKMGGVVQRSHEFGSVQLMFNCSDVPVVSLTLESSQVSIHWLPMAPYSAMHKH